jgi:hypothetical protein
MLNGLAPIIIFHLFDTAVVSKVSKWLKIETPKAQSFIQKFGIPVPVYLMEQQFKAVWRSHDVSINIGERPIGAATFQNPISNSIDIEIAYNRNFQSPSLSIIPLTPIAVLLPLLNLCYEKISQDDYRISYFNKDVMLLNGRLTDVRQHSEINTSLSTLSITLSREINVAEPAEKAKVISGKAKPTATPVSGVPAAA